MFISHRIIAWLELEGMFTVQHFCHGQGHLLYVKWIKASLNLTLNTPRDGVGMMVTVTTCIKTDIF